MSWKCVCKEQNNPDDSDVCKNCGRKKPKYLGIKLDLAASAKMSNEQKAVWFLLMGHDHLLTAQSLFKAQGGYEEKIGDNSYNQALIESKLTELRNKIKANCKKAIQLINKSEEIFPDAQFKDSDGYIQSINTLKSGVYFVLGNFCFRHQDYQAAINYYQKSFDADANQVSIYNIAMATINLPAEGGGGLFGGKKKQAAEEAKREQEIELLNKSLKFAPFSSLGMEAAKTLMYDYDFYEFDI